MNEMLTRVEKAISDRLAATGAEGVTSRDLARTAIGAMREPTEAMKEIGADTTVSHCWGNRGEFVSDPETIWHVMIDAALAE